MSVKQKNEPTQRAKKTARMIISKKHYQGLQSTYRQGASTKPMNNKRGDYRQKTSKGSPKRARKQ